MRSKPVSIISVACTIILSLSSLPVVRTGKICENVICYYDHNGYTRKGLGQMGAKDLRQAMPMCTHLVYGYVGIDREQTGLIRLKPEVDTENGADYLTNIPAMKLSFPDIKFYLSIGGQDDTESPEKYLHVLGTHEKRSKFVASIINFAANYKFQGIDLAWQFPKERRICNDKLPNKFNGSFDMEGASLLEQDPNTRKVKTVPVDRNKVRDNFSLFVKELWKETSSVNMELMLTVLPYVNVEFFEPTRLNDYVDFVHLMAYDYENPYYTPHEAYYWSVLKVDGNVCDRKRNHMTIESQIKSWIKNGMDEDKIILGIPAFGRIWKISERNYSDSTAVRAPEKTDDVGPAQPYTNTRGMIAIYEICYMLLNTDSEHLQAVEHVRTLGSAAVRKPTREVDGIWLAYDTLNYLKEKVKYAKRQRLAGLAVMDLSLDDFKGVCKHQTFPVLRTIKTFI